MRIQSISYQAFALALSMVSAATAARADPTQAPSLGAVIETATNVLQKVRAELENKRYPPLKSVTMNITTLASEKAEAGAKIIVLTVGSSITNERTRRLSIKLKSRPHEVKLHNSRTNIETGSNRRISDIIAQDLKANLLATFQRLSRHDDEATDPMSTETVTFTFGFKVTQSTAGGGAFLLEPASLTLGGSSAPANTNEFVFEFARPPTNQ